jgi:hypothetical protein
MNLIQELLIIQKTLEETDDSKAGVIKRAIDTINEQNKNDSLMVDDIFRTESKREEMRITCDDLVYYFDAVYDKILTPAQKKTNEVTEFNIYATSVKGML